MHPEMKGALGAFLYAGTYVLAPFLFIGGALIGAAGGYLICFSTLLAMSAGHVLATQSSAPVTLVEGVLETLFWCMTSTGTVLLVFFAVVRSWLALGIAGAAAGLAVWLWFASSARTRARIRTLTFVRF
ncbi:hypothetical protein [Pseudomonas mangrovi]|uniref:Uncharacterized protein n=1 Tax=Pseudomonas mangrovi TaxID=2161748 RepID=A0A2T5P9G6_9PSED|nr:hypothetical protein [Pseudomonas mangrovi]PTU74386.1 hypothetical protein DBO85_09840 [Pseudomonas mangrovi]